MNEKGIHTEILGSKKIGEIEIFQEEPYSFPNDKSNIYAKDSSGQILWYSEIPMEGDCYPNSISWNRRLNKDSENWDNLFIDDRSSFCVSSRKGYTVCISYSTGKIIDSVFTK